MSEKPQRMFSGRGGRDEITAFMTSPDPTKAPEPSREPPQEEGRGASRKPPRKHVITISAGPELLAEIREIQRQCLAAGEKAPGDATIVAVLLEDYRKMNGGTIPIDEVVHALVSEK